MLQEHDRPDSDRNTGQRQYAAAPISSLNPPLAPCPGRRPAEKHSPDVHRLDNVFDRSLTEVFTVEWQLVPDVFVDGPGDADTAGFRQTLQPRGDVDAVAVE